MFPYCFTVKALTNPNRYFVPPTYTLNPLSWICCDNLSYEQEQAHSEWVWQLHSVAIKLIGTISESEGPVSRIPYARKAQYKQNQQIITTISEWLSIKYLTEADSSLSLQLPVV